MTDLLCSVPLLPQALRRRRISLDYKANEKIQNILKIHHYEEHLSQSLDVDLVNNSVTAHQYGENTRVQKAFLFDSVSSKDNAIENVLITAIKGVVEKKDTFILSVSMDLRKKSDAVNQKILCSLVKWLMEYIAVCSESSDSRYSMRLSGLAIDEETDTIKELGSSRHEDKPITIENQYCHRCGDTAAASNIIQQLISHSQDRDRVRQQYLYTVHLYQQVSHSSTACSVSSQCSRIFLLQMDLSKHKNNGNCLSSSEFVKILAAAINKKRDTIDIRSNFQNLLCDICRKYSSTFSLITQISVKENHLSDSIQLLQMTSRIQRLKLKSTRCWGNKESVRSTRPAMGTAAYRKGEKYSDTEVASTSEISCAETVIFLGEERRRNSDDESRRFRSLFMSSDSDSGYRDLKISQSSECRGRTSAIPSKKQSRPRTNALVWPKSALRMAKTALLNGEELWVDGPNAEKKNDLSQFCVSTSCTKETTKQISSPCQQHTKPIMISQETQCGDRRSDNGERSGDDIRPLSDISEITENSDTIRNTKLCPMKEGSSHTSSPPQHNLKTDESWNLERNHVRNLSNWIHDVNELTSYQEFLTRELRERIMLTKHLSPVGNESVQSHSYQYYDPGSMGDYNSFPRVYTQIQYTSNNSPRCAVRTMDSDKEISSPFNEKKLNKRGKKKEILVQESYLKSKSFHPLDLLKKTLRRKKKKSIQANVSEVRCPELSYLMPSALSPGDSTDSTSSDSECNEWFRNVKTFKSKAECSRNKCSSIRPPSAPLLAGSSSMVRPQYSWRQRSSSSGYGSVVTRDSEISSHHDSTSDQSIQSSLRNLLKQSISFSQPASYDPTLDEIHPDVIAKRCETLVKQEKAFLLIQQQEIMIQDFYSSTRPLLTNDHSKYVLTVSSLDIDRVTTDNQYLEELEEDTNIIRDSIAFYKSLVQLESSFVTTPDQSRRHFH